MRQNWRLLAKNEKTAFVYIYYVWNQRAIVPKITMIFECASFVIGNCIHAELEREGLKWKTKGCTALWANKILLGGSFASKQCNQPIYSKTACFFYLLVSLTTRSESHTSWSDCQWSSGWWACGPRVECSWWTQESEVMETPRNLSFPLPSCSLSISQTPWKKKNRKGIEKQQI